MEIEMLPESEFHNILEEELTAYQNSTRKSNSYYAEAKKYLPGGVTRSLHFFEPYPIYIERGEGCYVFDVEGNSRIDFFSNATSLILGHSHPAVVNAVSEQMKKGTAFHGPTSHITELAKALCQRILSIEKIRFANSGSEATLLAILLAKAFTGKNKIAKFEGGYHGSHEYANISVHPAVELAGNLDEPKSVP
ncbi:MAG: aminotransferase class III-fold pyridoxal phosphate-dependent enzyme, partial [Candidatus Helarchaeota archaeon]|nr:aminotransferase class III-fold pyridoxal phosphate-dependent enzyme [Candidatus Helarchaeota archaeon]